MTQNKQITILSILFSFFLTAGCDILDSEDEDNEEPVKLTTSVYARGLVAPVGIEADSQGRLWIGEQGTGQNDSRISVITTDGQVHPFVSGLPSDTIANEITGAWRPHLNAGGSALLILQGEGAAKLSMSLLSADLTGFSPGDATLDPSSVKKVADIGDFVLNDQGFKKSNPYSMAIGPDGNQFIVDAGANAIIRRDTDTGELSVFTAFQDLSNPTKVGPPKIDVVPTDIIFKDGRFLVSTLTGFPFPKGKARIYEVDMQGNVSLLKKGFSALVDLAIDPRDGHVLALQIAQFKLKPKPGFRPNTGQLLQLKKGKIDTVVSGLNFSSGMHISTQDNDALFVSSLAEGQILRITYP